jgi:hypothetical protein
MEKKVSKSEQRYTFQRDSAIQRAKENGEEIDADYLPTFDDIVTQHNDRFDDPKSREHSMEYDLLTNDWILEKVRSDVAYAQNLYAAICNNTFRKRNLWPILKEMTWHCSWRYAGGIIADMQQKGDYIDWYCSGIRNEVDASVKEGWSDLEHKEYANTYARYVGEGFITDEIHDDLYRLGWMVVSAKL